jgi:hypothetical protein
MYLLACAWLLWCCLVHSLVHRRKPVKAVLINHSCVSTDLISCNIFTTQWRMNNLKIKYMVMSRERNAGRDDSLKIDNSSIEKVEEFKYLGTMVTDQNSIQKEIKSRLKLGNACYHSVQNLLSSRLLSKT